jgi:hypothetical protein
MDDMKAQAKAFRTCADTADAVVTTHDQVAQMRAQAAALTAQADAVEKAAHDAWMAAGCAKLTPASSPTEAPPMSPFELAVAGRFA